MSKRNVVIVGNWKMNKTPKEAKKFLLDLKKIYDENKNKINSNVIFGIASPSIDLSVINENKINSKMLIAAQDVHQKESGAYTGDLSISMIKSVGANSVVIGHSERRTYHGETNEIINEKTLLSLKNKINPIVCIGETLEERKSKKWKSVLEKQLKGSLKNLSAKQFENTIIAYEPIWAIGTGVTASADEAQEACKYVRDVISKIIGEKVSQKVIIQYGGSVKPENISEILSKEDIDGALVGGASLDPKMFLKLLTMNN